MFSFPVLFISSVSFSCNNIYSNIYRAYDTELEKRDIILYASISNASDNADAQVIGAFVTCIWYYRPFHQLFILCHVYITSVG